MKKEILINKTSEQALNITGGKVDSLRVKNKTTATVRVYSDGKIGIAGSLGAFNENKLTAAAIANLSRGIEYPQSEVSPQTVKVDLTKSIIAPQSFVEDASRLIETISSKNDDFIFSGKVIINENEGSYRHSDGADFNCKCNYIEVSLIIKHRQSADIFNEIYSCDDNRFDSEKIADDVAALCTAYNTQLPQAKGDEAVVILSADVLFSLASHFVCDLYFAGSSLFSGKLGKKLFSDKFGMLFDRAPDSALGAKFYDAEGVINKDYKASLIEKGVLKGLLTTKKSAQLYGVENIGNAATEDYNSVPTYSMSAVRPEYTHENVDAVLDGREALFISLTSGGDMTPDGILSLPVQCGYLYSGGEIKGRLPQFVLRASIFDMLGDGYLGACDKGVFSAGRQKYIVCKMQLVNKS